MISRGMSKEMIEKEIKNVLFCAENITQKWRWKNKT